MFFTDLIDIVRISTDINGAETRTTLSNVPAKVEDKVKVIKNAKGEDIMSSFFIALDSSTLIDYNDRIKIIKRNGIEWPQSSKEWSILSLSNVGGFSAHHMEVIT
jgi:MoaA/NifB/PqqE/SkfB family radical SAM enzyme